MMRLGHAIDRRRNALMARLQLQREIFRIMARLTQIAAMEPQGVLTRRLPHIAELALPGPRVLLGVRAEAPAFADLVGHLLRDELRRPAIHRAVAGGVD